MLIVTTLLLSCILKSVVGFSVIPHVIVSLIAQQHMSPSHVNTINNVLNKWTPMYPNSNDITTSSIWPDLIKDPNYGINTPNIRAKDDWHYVNADWHETLGSLAENPEDIFDNKHNAVFILEKTLKDFNSFRRIKNQNHLNILLRYFIHVFADIHQPMHTTNMHTTVFKSGDTGGNKWKFQQLKNQKSYRSLHHLWDHGGGVFDDLKDLWQDPTTKLSPRARKAFEKRSRELALKYHKDIVEQRPLLSALDLAYPAFSVEMEDHNIFRKIVSESASLAMTNVYNEDLPRDFVTPKKLRHPPQAYLDNAITFTERRLVTAGIRLSVFLSQFARQLEQKSLDTLL